MCIRNFLFVLLYLPFLKAQYGLTLSRTSFPKSLTCLTVACSWEGDRVVTATNRSIYISQDYGFSWSVTSAPEASWIKVVSSASGQYLYASVKRGRIYRSNNYGLNWTLSSSPSSDSYVLATSSSGQYVFAASAQGYVIFSNDSGVSWDNSEAYTYSLSAITCSSSGQYVTISDILRVSVYVSNNYGRSFNKSSSILPWVSLDTNSSGSFQIAASNYGSIYMSADYGITWLSSGAPYLKWDSACMSGSGQVIYAVGTLSVYYSVDFGDSWFPAESPSLNWNAIATSFSGQYVYVTSSSGLYTNFYYPSSQPTSMPTLTPSSWPSTVPSSSPTIYSLYDYSLSQIYSLKYYYSLMAMSASGQFIYAGVGYDGYLRSSNFGNSWILNPNFKVEAIAINANGSIIYFAGDYVFSSTDYGSTLTQTVLRKRTYPTIATDETGQFVYTTDRVMLFYSRNFGADWNSSLNATNMDFSAMACSASGQYVTALTGGGFIFASQNYGLNYSQVYSNLVGGQSISISYSGQYQLAVSYLSVNDTLGFVYVSTDFGRSWSVTSAPHKEWVSTAMDAAGQYMFAGQYYGGVYFSTNYGKDWNKIESIDAGWKTLGVSLDAQFLVAVAYDHGIYSNQYKIPSSVPTNQPSSMSYKPHSSFPSSQPSSVPSIIPTSQPSSFPTFIPDKFVETTTVSTVESSLVTVFNNLGCGSTVFVWATILVSYLDAESLGAISITADSEYDSLILANRCAPSTLCGLAQCAANFNVTSVVSCSGGGSLTLTANTVNVNQFTGVDTRCTYNGTSGLQFAIQYSVSAFSLPTANPTRSPTVQGDGNLVFEASPDTPFYIIFCVVLLHLALGVALVRQREKNGEVTPMKLISVGIDLGLIGYHLSSELFYIIVVYSEGLYSLAYGILCIRLSGLIPGIYLLTCVYGSFEYSKFYKNKLNRSHLFSNASLYSIITILMMLEQTMIRYLPWKTSAYTRESRGFPNQHLLLVCTVAKLLQLLSALGIQTTVLMRTSIRNNSSQIALALVVLYLISSVSTIVIFGVTNGIRLGASEDNKNNNIQQDSCVENPIDSISAEQDMVELKVIKESTGGISHGNIEERVALLFQHNFVKDAEIEKLKIQESLKDKEIQCLLKEYTELKNELNELKTLIRQN